jgi:WD40 repeat protein
VLVKQPIKIQGDPTSCRLALWNIESGMELFACTRASQVLRYCYAPKPQILALALERDARVEWLDVRTGRVLHSFADYREPMRFSPDGRWFAACSGSGIMIFEVATARTCRELKSPPHPYYYPAFSPDGHYFLGPNNEICQTRSGKRQFSVPGTRDHCAFTPDSKALAVMSRSTGWLTYYDLASGQERRERRVQLIQGGPLLNSMIQATSDGRLLVVDSCEEKYSPTGTNTFVVLDAQTGRELLRGKGGYCLDCTPDGKHARIVMNDHSHQFWALPPP